MRSTPDYIAKMTGVPYTAENITVTAGGMASLFLGLMCMVDTGDEVLVSAPYFCNYQQMIAMCHGVTVRWTSMKRMISSSLPKP